MPTITAAQARADFFNLLRQVQESLIIATY
jgi:hypothetical protein